MTPRSGMAVTIKSNAHAAIMIHDGAALPVPSSQARALVTACTPKGTERTARSPASALIAAVVHHTAMHQRIVGAIDGSASRRRQLNTIHGSAAVSGSAIGIPLHAVTRTVIAAHHPG